MPVAASTNRRDRAIMLCGKTAAWPVPHGGLGLAPAVRVVAFREARAPKRRTKITVGIV